MTEAQEMTIELGEIDELITRLKSHATTSMMTGYFEAAYDVNLACKKLENLVTLLNHVAEK